MVPVAISLTGPAWSCFFFFFSSRRRHTRSTRDWSSDVCSSDLQFQGPAQPVERAPLVREPVRRVAYARRRLGRIGMPRDGDLEEAPRLVQSGFTEQRAPDLEHEVVVVPETQREDAVETGDGAAPLTELEQHLAQPGQGVFMLGVEAHRFLERPARPDILLSGKPGVAHTDVQLDGV